MMGNLFGVSKQKIFVKKFLVLGSKNAGNDIFYSKINVPKHKTYSNLQFYHHFSNKGKTRGYNQLVELIKSHLSLAAVRLIIIFPRFLNPI